MFFVLKKLTQPKKYTDLNFTIDSANQKIAYFFWLAEIFKTKTLIFYSMGALIDKKLHAYFCGFEFSNFQKV
jgi:hypothetical protein